MIGLVDDDLINHILVCIDFVIRCDNYILLQIIGLVEMKLILLMNGLLGF